MTPLEKPHCFFTAVIIELITKIITRANYINFHQNRISVACERQKRHCNNPKQTPSLTAFPLPISVKIRPELRENVKVVHQQVNHQMAVCVVQASHQPSALNFHSQTSCRHRTKQAELIAAPFRRASTLFGFLMSSLKTQFITHNPFSTLLEMQEFGRGGGGGGSAWPGDSSVPFTLGMSLSLSLSPAGPTAEISTLIPSSSP